MKQTTLLLFTLTLFVSVSAQQGSIIAGTQTQSSGRSSHQIYIIPVVFHVLHEYGPENISEWQIRDAIRILNEDFRKLNADTDQIIPIFQSIAADCEIEFRLANIDPNGNCTNGIDRIFTPRTILANDSSKLNIWPTNKYLNIWTAASLENSAAYGYTHLPGGPTNVDGIMMWNIAVGSIGTSSVQTSRQLTHEAGHYFNLQHVGSSTCLDDGVADTPLSHGWDHCDLNGSICNPPIIENVQNFMEYSGCQVMFTAGQAARMHAALNSSVSGRNNLWTSSNLIATGTNGPPTLCNPKAQFVTTQFACPGGTVVFTDISSNRPITSWQWSFPGGNPSTSTDSVVSVSYAAPGQYDATLVVTNAAGVDSISKTATVYVSDTVMNSIPFTEDFEAATSLPGIDGWLSNDDSSTYQWERTMNANTTPGGAYSIMFNNFSSPVHDTDAWITPPLDFTNVSFPIRVGFKVAYAQRDVNSYDDLRVHYSTDCGVTWYYSNYAKAGPVLATVSNMVTNSFIPADSTQWRQESVTCNAVQHMPNVRFKFVNISDHGNNIYIDDINITGDVLGTDESDGLGSGITIYPNPTGDISTLRFQLPETAHARITLKNILGQQLWELNDAAFERGTHEIKLPSMTNGIYFVDIVLNEKHFVRKWIVE